jgi:uncharacterized membrane protein
MNTRYVPPIVFGLSWLAFLAYLVLSAGQLPERVATHFNLTGQPDGWMTAAQATAFDGAMGLGLPLLIVGICYVIRFVPNRLINLPGPRREYWLGPEQRPATMAHIFRHSFWLASMLIGLIAGVHYLILEANRQGIAPHLSVPAAIVLVACFLLALVAWFVALFHHFSYFQ